MDNLFIELGDVKDLIVEEKSKIIWTDVSSKIQNKKADKVQLSVSDREEIFNGLMKRPSYLSNIANLIGAKNIVEVGTAEGLQFFTFAQNVSDDCNVWSCDIEDKRNSKYTDKFPNAHFCLGTSKTLSEQMPKETLVDLFYIDGAHSKGDVLIDVDNLKKFQHNDTYWIFDDYDERFGCYDDISQLIEKNKNYKIYHVGNTSSNQPNHQVIIHGKL